MPTKGSLSSQAACKASLERLGLDYLDLYLIHWPAAQLGKYVDSFGGLIQFRANGLVRSIGVCNFTEEHLDTVIDLTFVTPAVNQIELHPLLNQAELRAVNAAAQRRDRGLQPAGGRQAGGQSHGDVRSPANTAARRRRC